MSRWLGVGIGLRGPHLPALLEAAEPPLAVLELTPSHFFARPEPLVPLARAYALVLHDVFASLPTASTLDRAHLEAVAELARGCGAIEYSEHLALTRSPRGLDLGHLIPVPYTRPQLELLVEHLRASEKLLELPLAVELPVTCLRLPAMATTMSEGEFVCELVARTGCGLHLDLENLLVDAHNEIQPVVPHDTNSPAQTQRFGRLAEALRAAGLEPKLVRPLARRLAALPLTAVTRVHLAGGSVAADGWRIDSHSAPVSSANFALLRALKGLIEPRAIIIERDTELPDLSALVAQARHAEAVWAA